MALALPIASAAALGLLLLTRRDKGPSREAADPALESLLNEYEGQLLPGAATVSALQDAFQQQLKAGLKADQVRRLHAKATAA